ncbi:Disrupted in renal carcinoma protein 2-like protein [Armadillidium nasatum]|uniref:Disrupted in renal carcinoma protein 2-like protein n=1 Tax=Armadillidium nasatum TaxID=96803 RepID=A0A5N5TCV4_9CRUS|nr:Disrupted in renal carcinoma protein 2-like protein [Armadillidium nasatum]
MGSCLTLSLPAMLSSTWFPMEERATATAVAAVATQLGGAGMYLSPLLVRTPDDILTKDEIANDIFILMYIPGFIAAFLYFPEKPSKPPSVSSSMERINYFTSIKLIMRNPQVLCVITAYVFSMSIPLTWVSIMNFSLECLGVAQTESMWIAITACLASPLFSFVVARVTDHSYGYLKVTIVGLLLSSSCFYIWILLMTETVASSSYEIVASSSYGKFLFYLFLSSSCFYIRILLMTEAVASYRTVRFSVYCSALFVAVVFAISLQYSSVPLLIRAGSRIGVPLSRECNRSYSYNNDGHCGYGLFTRVDGTVKMFSMGQLLFTRELLPDNNTNDVRKRSSQKV